MSIFVAPVRNSKPTEQGLWTTNHAQNDASSSAAKVDVHVDLHGAESDSLHISDENDQESLDESDEAAGNGEDWKYTNKETKTSKHRSLRRNHLDVLVALLHKSMLDADWPRAERAYALLLRSKGVDIRLCHNLGLKILEHTDDTGARSMEFMSRLIVAYPPIKERRGKRAYDRADVFVRILTNLRIKYRQYSTALQELDGWLLIPPYKDDAILWKLLIHVCEVLEVEANNAGDQLQAHRFKQKRMKAISRASGSELTLDEE